MKIVHADFVKRMAGVQMYMKSIAGMQIQDLAARIYVARAEIPSTQRRNSKNENFSKFLNGFLLENRIKYEARSGYQKLRRSIMRKAFLGVLATMMTLSVGTTSAFAAIPGAGPNYVDANGDGICDYANSICAYVDIDRDGICDVCGAKHGNCLTVDEKNFVDVNGDGICDNCGKYHWCGRIGTGWGRNFADADGDGICDNYIAGQTMGSGRGCGRNFAGVNGDGVYDNYPAGPARGNGRGCGFRGGRSR